MAQNFTLRGWWFEEACQESRVIDFVDRAVLPFVEVLSIWKCCFALIFHALGMASMRP